jgi:hypothetical protein
MTGRQTGEQRDVPMPRDYFKRPDLLQRWKLRLTIVALVVAAGWCLAGLVRSDGGRTRYSRGPVAAAHATWESECAACHVSFQPIGSHVGVSAWVGGAHASDPLCQKCHAGPAHSSRQIAGQVPACADCHREHRGPDASLVHIKDENCTQCHANLVEHLNPNGPGPQFGNASRFALHEHPEFKDRLTGKHPSNLKFSHQLHLTPGMWPNSKKRPLFTLERIKDDTQRERFRAQQPEGQRGLGAAVQLTCASCHRLDSGDFGIKIKPSSLEGLPLQPLLPPRGAGAYMLPITFENQCQACHLLETIVGQPKDREPLKLKVPHRLQPAQIHEFLERSLLVDLVKDKPLLDEHFRPKRTRPGEAPIDELAAQKTTLRKLLGELVMTAETSLYADHHTCSECHRLEGKLDIQPSTVPKFKVVPTEVPSVWLPHARFSHAAHGALKCIDCHARAESSETKAETPRADKDVLIPGMENCLQCHGPSRRSEGKAIGGARFDCTECHRYHNGDAPLQGRGAAARALEKRLTIQQFLSGGRTDR